MATIPVGSGWGVSGLVLVHGGVGGGDQLVGGGAVAGVQGGANAHADPVGDAVEGERVGQRDLQVGDDAGDGFAAVPGQVDEQGEELVPAEAGDQVFPA